MTFDLKMLPYRLGVGAMVINAEGKVFVGRRADNRSGIEAWQMPQGGIDPGEDPKKALLRELDEEIGTSLVEIIHEAPNWLLYDLPIKLIPTVWSGKYRGQKQKWYLCLLQGDDDLINIHTSHPEFIEWKWVEPEETIELIVPFKRELYQDLLKEFLPVIREVLK